MNKILKCISNKGAESHITIGKEYELLNIVDVPKYQIMDDRGLIGWLSKDYFEIVKPKDITYTTWTPASGKFEVN